jgi:hypothetical protein
MRISNGVLINFIKRIFPEEVLQLQVAYRINKHATAVRSDLLVET